MSHDAADIAVSALVRAALFVSDLDRSLHFYRDVIGLPETFAKGDTRDEAFAALLGMPAETDIRYRILQIPGPPRGMVGLFEVRNPTPEKLGQRKPACAVGEVALVFYSGEFDALERRLDAEGVSFICRPRYLSVRAGVGQQEMTFRDPDGIMVNVIDRSPDAGLD
jgi:catechol 2,3-dioxygenase-like lactoylglutathione lyase family enzyme